MSTERSPEQWVFTLFDVTMMAVMALLWIVPVARTVRASSWIQYLAYLGGFLTAADVVGAARVKAADAYLARHYTSITRRVDEIVRDALRIAASHQERVDDLAKWYIFSLLALVLVIVCGIAVLPLLWATLGPERLVFVLLGSLLATSLVLFFLGEMLPLVLGEGPRSPMLRRVVNGVSSTAAALLDLLAEWYGIGWLACVFGAWCIWRAFLAIVWAKNRFALGSIFLVIGTLLLLASLVLQVAQNLHSGSPS